MRVRVALVIGHSQKRQGAYNQLYKMSEFKFNDMVAHNIEEFGGIDGITLVYRDSYKDLPDQINRLGPEIIFSLHCNAFNTQASGTEVLYYHTSKMGKLIAGITQNHIVSALELPDRGIKAKKEEDRGGYLLRYTDAPCVIVEPFFIDNNDDYRKVRGRLDKLIFAYIESIKDALAINIRGDRQ